MRSAAVEKGLDPETTWPEDILLASSTESGKLRTVEEYEKAMERAAFYRNIEKLKAMENKQ